MGKKSGGREGKFDARRWEDSEDAPSYEKKRQAPVVPEVPKPASDPGPQKEEAQLTGLREATVISTTRRICSVVAEDEILDCYLTSRLAAVQQSEIAPGDRVLFGTKDDGNRMIQSALPRKTFLARPDPHNARKQRVIAANIDTVVNVVAVKNPPLRPRLIDRYLIAIMEGGAKPIICVNKVDLLDDEALREELRCLDVYRDLGIETVLCSIEDGRGLDELMSKLRGGTSVFVGHSGVGKSSILKKLVTSIDGEGGGEIKTGAVTAKQGTGRHTTRQATLYDLGEGTSIIDTPGIREFGLWNLDEETLRSYFPEFDELAGDCRFNDCSHSHEPECAVKTAAEEGHISKARLDTYHRLHEELREQGELR
ncbi:MAG TPA: ribosome small subunit-dependent GTPase A [Thermoanaerobaculia bacterium]|nr:ribosome small subunit-dependent GTPase A [Thermoanaerobaculia bacterium]